MGRRHGARTARARTLGRGGIAIRPARLGYLIATLFVLSLSVAVGSARYPDRPIVHCDGQSPDEEPGCFIVEPENFRARAWVIGSGVGVGCILFALAFRRKLDAHG